MITFKKLLDNCCDNGVEVNEKQLQKTYDFAVFAYGDLKRRSGEPLINHPLTVANTLASWHQPQVVIQAALLHDTIEDSFVTVTDIQKEFGSEIATLVDTVTKVGEVKLRGSTNEVFTENLRKMFIAMSRDIRVVLIRLADRLHNLETLSALPHLKSVRIAKESLEIYAPLAERLGMGAVKGQIEDLSFAHAYPDRYHWVVELSKTPLAQATRFADKAIKTLQIKLAENNIPAHVHGRSKHFYSLYNKLHRPEIDKDITKIHDLLALRIITGSIKDCYAALGVVHQTWKPAPHLGLSDYIAQPKPNGYQSIHTRVFGPHGGIIEVQVRTEEMHHQAEYGLAAHWSYSEAKTKGASGEVLNTGIAIPKKLQWVRQLIDWQTEVKDNQEYLKSVTLDALEHRIFVYSPKGDVFDLPRGATPIDYAYAVHSDLVKYLRGTKVNGKSVPLSYQLKSGDLVEITKSKQTRQPSRDWLSFVKTSRARLRIHQSLKSQA